MVLGRYLICGYLDASGPILSGDMQVAELCFSETMLCVSSLNQALHGNCREPTWEIGLVVEGTVAVAGGRAA